MGQQSQYQPQQGSQMYNPNPYYMEPFSALGQMQSFSSMASEQNKLDDLMSQRQMQDRMAAVDPASRFAAFDRTQDREKLATQIDQQRNQVGREQQRRMYQQYAAAPYAAELAQNNRARALGYGSFAQMNEPNNENQRTQSLLSGLLGTGGLAGLMEPFSLKHMNSPQQYGGGGNEGMKQTSFLNSSGSPVGGILRSASNRRSPVAGLL